MGKLMGTEVISTGKEGTSCDGSSDARPKEFGKKGEELVDSSETEVCREALGETSGEAGITGSGFIGLATLAIDAVGVAHKATE